MKNIWIAGILGAAIIKREEIIDIANKKFYTYNQLLLNYREPCQLWHVKLDA